MRWPGPASHLPHHHSINHYHNDSSFEAPRALPAVCKWHSRVMRWMSFEKSIWILRPKCVFPPLSWSDGMWCWHLYRKHCDPFFLFVLSSANFLQWEQFLVLGCWSDLELARSVLILLKCIVTLGYTNLWQTVLSSFITFLQTSFLMRLQILVLKDNDLSLVTIGKNVACKKKLRAK